MSSTSSRKIDFRSLCYGVDKYMDAPEPAYLFPGHTFYQPMKRNRSNHGQSRKKESR